MATTAAVRLLFETKGAERSLDRANSKTKKLNRNVKATKTSLHGASGAAKGFGASLGAAIAPIVAITAAVGVVGKSLKVFGDRQRDVKVLAQGLSRLKGGVGALNSLNAAADRLGKETLFSEDDFRKGFNLLTSFKAIGVDSYDRVAKSAADIAHVNQVDVKTSFMQLAKALQDPERNLAALNRSGIAFTKTETEKIKALMASNKAAEAHAEILRIVEGSYKGLAVAGAKGFAGDVDSLGESWSDFMEVLGEAVIPIMTPVVKGLTTLLEAAVKLKGPILEVSVAIGGALGLTWAFGKLKASIVAVNVALSLNPWYLLATGIAAATVAIYRGVTANERFVQGIADGVVPVDQGIAKLKEYEAEITAIEEKLGNVTGSNRNAKAERIRLERELEALQAKIDVLKGAVTQVQDAATAAAAPDEAAISNLDYVLEKWKEIGQTVRSDVTGAIKGAITGSMSLGDAMGRVLNSIAEKALDVALNMALWGKSGSGGLLGGLFKGIFGSAQGGTIGAGNPRIVGERGPELFVPHSSGTVVPNNRIGGSSNNIVVNVSAGGVASSGDGNQERELGKMLGVVVQQELIRQQRPGGLLA